MTTFTMPNPVSADAEIEVTYTIDGREEEVSVDRVIDTDSRADLTDSVYSGKGEFGRAIFAAIFNRGEGWRECRRGLRAGLGRRRRLNPARPSERAPGNRGLFCVQSIVPNDWDANVLGLNI
jgi:hypothetical protein